MVGMLIAATRSAPAPMEAQARHDTRLAQKIGIELERDVGFHDETRLAR